MSRSITARKMDKKQEKKEFVPDNTLPSLDGKDLTRYKLGTYLEAVFIEKYQPIAQATVQPFF